uniref:Coiled-coil domain-containing protein 39 n=1 Tax=Xiphophorus maculatus TaxID=8083 RepID=M3ZQT3_XIPMA
MASRDFDKFSDPEFDKILYEIGWDYSFVLPELNDANKALMEEVRQSRTVKTPSSYLCTRIMLSHCLFDCVQALIKANEKELEVTKHLKTLAERERSRYCQLTAQAEREIKSSYEKMDRIEKSQLKATQNLEELRLQMDLDQQTMENLLAEAAKKDEDLMVIMKYTQMDEHKIKSLTLTIEKKTLEVKEKRKALDKELTETRSTQLALDKSIEDIQRARAEIQHLFHLCENTIKQKKQLDSDMERCSFVRCRQKTREKNTCVAEMKHKLDTERSNNRELQRNIATARMQKAVLRQDLKKHQENLARMQVEVSFSKHTPLLLAFQQELMEELFRQRQSFQSAKVKEKNLIALASKNKFTITNLLSQLTKMENTLIRQQMINNNQVLMLQRKVAQLSGASHTNESEMLEVKVKELTANLEDKKETTKILKNALNECEVCLKKHFLTDFPLKFQWSYHILHMASVSLADRYPLCEERDGEDGLVNNNLLKTEVKRVRDIIYIDADSMMSWEMRKLELEKAMKEREEEIHVYSEMLRHQLKFTELDRQKLSMELNEELSKVEMVKNRFEIMESSLAGSEGEKSQIYYITKATLDKEELRRKSEDMKEHIQKMELETKALENTIHLFSGRCSDYSNGLSEMKKFSEEYQEKMQLEERLKTVEETLKLKKRQIQELRQEIQSLMLEEKVEKEKTRHVQGLIANLNKEAASAQERISRFTKLTREVRSAQSTRSETLEEQDIKLKELKQFNKSINNMLSKAMEEDPDLRPVLEERFQKVVFLMLPRSSASSAGSSHSKSLPWVKTVNLNLDLSAAYPTITSPKSPSSPSSSDSSSSKKTK